MKEHPEYQYINLVKEVLEAGVKNLDRGTKAVSYSVFGRQCRYDLSKGFPLLTTKKVYWKGVIHELYWFISGQSNIKYLVDNNVHVWDDYPYKTYQLKVREGKAKDITKEEFIQKITDDASFAKKYGEMPRIYGEMWRRWPTRKKSKTIDQLAWVIEELKEDPHARNAIVTSWNPEYLYTMAGLKDTSHFPICHNVYQVSVKEGKVYLQLYQRSADLFLGVPFNIGSYALLTLIIAKILGYKPGEFIHTFGDAHIYENHLDQVKEQLRRKPKGLPTVKIDPSVEDLDDFRPELVVLEDYDPHPPIKGALTVSGGYYEKDYKRAIGTIPTAASLLIKNSKVLIVKHKKGAGHLEGTYGLPSGLVKKGEGEKSAAERELKEETGLKTAKEDLKEFPDNFYVADIKRSDGTVKKFSWKVFYCKKFKGSLEKSDKTIPMWVSFKDLSRLKLLPNVKKAAEAGRKYLKNEKTKN